jgi:arsenate reductase (thioredoxin)
MHHRTTVMFATALLFLLGTCHNDTAHAADDSIETVVFVCEHGAVKSLVAAVLFNKRAAERGWSVRAVARGMTPDASVPQRIVEALRNDHVDVAAFRPQALSAHDIEHAAILVTIGVDAARVTPQTAVIDQWSDIPDSSSYTQMHQALLRRVERLLDAAEIAQRHSPRRQ